MTTRSFARPLLAGAIAASLALSACQGGANQSADGNAAGDAPSITAPQGATELEIVRAMLDLAEVRPEDLVVDLGSGDGRIPIMAAQLKGARGLGVEIDPGRIRQSNANASRAGVATRVEFRQQDLFVTPLNEVTVLTLFLLPEINLQLRPKILAQMRPGTRVVSNTWDMGDWRPDRRRTVGGTNIFLWIVPAAIDGRWTFQGDGGGSGELAVTQSYQDFAGTVSAGGRTGPIGDGQLSGDRIAFTADLGQGRRRYEGRVEGNSMTGNGWRAARASGG
jgi:SAM-dependent methyltransferase